MDTRVFFAFLALSSVLVANVGADCLLLDTMRLIYFHRPNNSDIVVKLENATDLVPLMDKNETTVLYVSGYLESPESVTVPMMRNTFVNYTRVNLIILDYSKMGLIYPMSVECVPYIAAALATAINHMVEAGLILATLHLIGFSLGAQICGYTGRKTNKPIVRITGLDPAGPLFTDNGLSASDATLVDCVHTDMNGFGTNRTYCTIDFIMNGGVRDQPGCVEEFPKILIGPGACSHFRAPYFYADSVKYPVGFPSVKCDSQDNFKNNTCDTSNIVVMGFHVPLDSKASGLYYCQTNKYSPYSRGMAGTVYDDTL